MQFFTNDFVRFNNKNNKILMCLKRDNGSFLALFHFAWSLIRRWQRHSLHFLLPCSRQLERLLRQCGMNSVQS